MADDKKSTSGKSGARSASKSSTAKAEGAAPKTDRKSSQATKPRSLTEAISEKAPAKSVDTKPLAENNSPNAKTDQKAQSEKSNATEKKPAQTRRKAATASKPQATRTTADKPAKPATGLAATAPSAGLAKRAKPAQMTAPAARSVSGSATAASAAAAVQSEPVAPAEPAIEPDPVPSKRAIHDDTKRRAAAPARERIAANDDAPSIGGLLYALNAKPSAQIKTYTIAAILAWLTISAGYTALFFTNKFSTTTSLYALLSDPTVLLIAATIFVPPIIFGMVGALLYESREMKLKSSALTEVAVRLAEPDKLAEQSVASLGQSVRRQASAMNEAVSRAIGRASELESLVRGEVQALESSYTENETRIRGLIAELASERQALANNSARVRTEIEGLGKRVTGEILDATTHITRTVADAGEQVNRRITENSDRSAQVLSESGNNMMSSLANMNKRITVEVPGLLQKLSDEQKRLTTIIDHAGKNLGSLESELGKQTGQLDNVLNVRSDQLKKVISDYTASVDETLVSRTKALADALSSRYDAFNSSFATQARKLEASITENAESIERSVTQRSAALDKALVDRTKAIDDAFASRVDQALRSKSDEVRKAMETYSSALSTSLEKQQDHLDETLTKGITAVRASTENITEQSMRTIESLSEQAQTLRVVSQDILGQIAELTSRFEGQSASINKAAHALETSNFKIDSVLEARHAELAGLLDNISNKAQDFDRQLADYSSSIDNSLTDAEQRARSVTEQLAQGTQATSQAAIAELENLRRSTEQEAEQTLHQLRSRFSSVSDEVTNQITSLDRTHSTLREKTEEAAAEIARARQKLNQEVSSLPETARTSSTVMRDALQEQLKALDALTIMARDQAKNRDVTLPPAGYATPNNAGLARQYQAAPAATVSSGTVNAIANGISNQTSSPQTHSNPRPIQQQSLQPEPGRSGWSLGDLLARASLEDQAGTGNGSSIYPFNVNDAANALDTNTATHIWNRFRAGERGVLNRSVYSQAGQTTFDNVKDRYETDGQFQAAVNRYLLDFEKMLKDAQQVDANNPVIQQHLLSETGRIYLLLAHASGRLS